MEKNEGFVSREKEKRAHIRFVNKRDNGVFSRDVE